MKPELATLTSSLSSSLSASLNYQAQFQLRWPQLNHPEVRSLAWLLDSPVLLNSGHARWANQLVRLPAMTAATADWLAQLDQEPQPLLDYLAVHAHTRLGHFAENLLAFYFEWCGELVAHSVQVRSHTTIGEFDFLLTTPNGFEHWEFACKFYLLVPPGDGMVSTLADYVGPNRMDNLNDKSHKIMDAQLALGLHHDAQKYLPTPLLAARALLKGWLFYPDVDSAALPEVAPDHCRGLWCRLSDFSAMEGKHYAVLARLSWLAPAKMPVRKTLDSAQMSDYLERKFLTDARPVLLARLDLCGEVCIETERIFVVPDNWN